MKTLILVFITLLSTSTFAKRGYYFIELREGESPKKILSYLGVNSQTRNKNTFHGVHKVTYATVKNDHIFISVKYEKNTVSNRYSILPTGEISFPESERENFQKSNRTIASEPKPGLAYEKIIVKSESNNNHRWGISTGAHTQSLSTDTSSVGLAPGFSLNGVYHYKYSDIARVQSTIGLERFAYNEAGFTTDNSFLFEGTNKIIFGRERKVSIATGLDFHQVPTIELNNQITKNTFARPLFELGVPVNRHWKHRHTVFLKGTYSFKVMGDAQIDSATGYQLRWEYYQFRKDKDWNYSLSGLYENSSFTAGTTKSSWSKIGLQLGFDFQL